MTWPTTPINTSNLDNGADEPRLARVDIKNMADAVNAMIDYGDPINQIASCILRTQGSWDLSNPQWTTTEITDPVNVVTTSSNVVTFAPGVYAMDYYGSMTIAPFGGGASTTTYIPPWQGLSGSSQRVDSINQSYLNVVTTTNLEVRLSGSYNSASGDFYIKITKIA
jgi:hypothetical protein